MFAPWRQRCATLVCTTLLLIVMRGSIRLRFCVMRALRATLPVPAAQRRQVKMASANSAARSVRIDVYSDISCPWCLVASNKHCEPLAGKCAAAATAPLCFRRRL